jgi:hypothetical protein
MNVLTELSEYQNSYVSFGGSANAVSYEPDEVNEAIRLLHEAVKEVTGRAVEPKPKARMGFL